MVDAVYNVYKVNNYRDFKKKIKKVIDEALR
jgi:hypothetical protein